MFTELATRTLALAWRLVSVPGSVYFWRNFSCFTLSPKRPKVYLDKSSFPLFTLPLMKNWMSHNEDEQYHYLCCKLYHLNGQEIEKYIFYTFLSKFLFLSMAFCHEQSCFVSIATKVVQPLKRAFLCIPWVPNYMQIWRGVEIFHFPSRLILTETTVRYCISSSKYPGVNYFKFWLQG